MPLAEDHLAQGPNRQTISSS